MLIACGGFDNVHLSEPDGTNEYAFIRRDGSRVEGSINFVLATQHTLIRSALRNEEFLGVEFGGRHMAKHSDDEDRIYLGAATCH